MSFLTCHAQRQKAEARLKKEEEERKAKEEAEKKTMSQQAFREWTDQKARAEQERKQELHLLQSLIEEHHKVPAAYLMFRFQLFFVQRIQCLMTATRFAER